MDGLPGAEDPLEPPRTEPFAGDSAELGSFSERLEAVFEAFPAKYGTDSARLSKGDALEWYRGYRLENLELTWNEFKTYIDNVLGDGLSIEKAVDQLI